MGKLTVCLLPLCNPTTTYYTSTTPPNCHQPAALRTPPGSNREDGNVTCVMIVTYLGFKVIRARTNYWHYFKLFMHLAFVIALLCCSFYWFWQGPPFLCVITTHLPLPPVTTGGAAATKELFTVYQTFVSWLTVVILRFSNVHSQKWMDLSY